jgi:hypothetical protein
VSAAETEDEALNATIAQAMRDVESQATPEELEAGREAARKIVEEEQIEVPQKKKETNGFNFF